MRLIADRDQDVWRWVKGDGTRSIPYFGLKAACAAWTAGNIKWERKVA